MKKEASGTHRTQPNKTIVTQYENSRRIEKGQKIYLKAIMAENF